MVIGRGGAGVVVDALEGLLHDLGGRIVLNSEVEHIETRSGRAVAVTVHDGSRYEASRAVVANLTPGALFSKLIAPEDLDPAFRKRASHYRYGPGTMMIHLAMDAPAPWRDASINGHTYVHAAPFLDDLSLAYAQAVAGLLPARPMIVVGQPTAIDPSRAPSGKHVLWIQVRAVPGKIRGDALGEITGRQWDEIKEAYADRVLQLLEEYAPGIGRLILGRHVMSPEDLERANPNLVGGDHLGGSHHLVQHYLLRPVPGYSRYSLPIDRLYMCGAGTWPGGGVGAGSGYLLGNMLVKSSRIGRAKRSLSGLAGRTPHGRGRQ
jgi:phytoene dehydrogenase-like protein